MGATCCGVLDLTFRHSFVFRHRSIQVGNRSGQLSSIWCTTFCSAGAGNVAASRGQWRSLESCPRLIISLCVPYRDRGFESSGAAIEPNDITCREYQFADERFATINFGTQQCEELRSR